MASCKNDDPVRAVFTITYEVMVGGSARSSKKGAIAGTHRQPRPFDGGLLVPEAAGFAPCGGRLFRGVARTVHALCLLQIQYIDRQRGETMND